MEVPPRVEYSLTDNGQALIPALKALADWGKEMKTLIFAYRNKQASNPHGLLAFKRIGSIIAENMYASIKNFF